MGECVCPMCVRARTMCVCELHVCKPCVCVYHVHGCVVRGHHVQCVCVRCMCAPWTHACVLQGCACVWFRGLVQLMFTQKVAVGQGLWFRI
jgi:hypothetical protein